MKKLLFSFLISINFLFGIDYSTILLSPGNPECPTNSSTLEGAQSQAAIYCSNNGSNVLTSDNEIVNYCDSWIDTRTGNYPYYACFKSVCADGYYSQEGWGSCYPLPNDFDEQDYCSFNGGTWEFDLLNGGGGSCKYPTPEEECVADLGTWDSNSSTCNNDTKDKCISLGRKWIVTDIHLGGWCYGGGTDNNDTNGSNDANNSNNNTPATFIDYINATDPINGFSDPDGDGVYTANNTPDPLTDSNGTVINDPLTGQPLPGTVVCDAPYVYCPASQSCVQNTPTNAVYCDRTYDPNTCNEKITKVLDDFTKKCLLAGGTLSDYGLFIENHSSCNFYFNPELVCLPNSDPDTPDPILESPNSPSDPNDPPTTDPNSEGLDNIGNKIDLTNELLTNIKNRPDPSSETTDDILKGIRSDLQTNNPNVELVDAVDFGFAMNHDDLTTLNDTTSGILGVLKDGDVPAVSGDGNDYDAVATYNTTEGDSVWGVGDSLENYLTDVYGVYSEISTLYNNGFTFDYAPVVSSPGCLNITAFGKSISLDPCGIGVKVAPVIKVIMQIIILFFSIKIFIYGLNIHRS